MGFRLSDFVQHFGGELIGDDLAIAQVATLESAGSADLVFIGNEKYAGKLGASQAGAVILTQATAGLTERPRIVATNPYLYFAKVATLLNPPMQPASGVHPQASVAASAHIGEGACVAAFASVGEGAVIGAGAVIESGARIGQHAEIGAGSRILANAVVCHGCILGERVIIHPNAVIGADGFGNAWTGEGWYKIPQIGRVLIGNDVEIGAATTIDRGALGDTVIEEGVRIDNLVQIAHNVHVGKHTAIAACTGIAGSARIGAYCTIAGAVMMVGHIEIADKVNILGGTLVGKSITQPGLYGGHYPMQKHEDWLGNAAHLRRLDTMAKRLKELERTVGAMTPATEKDNNDPSA